MNLPNEVDEPPNENRSFDALLLGKPLHPKLPLGIHHLSILSVLYQLRRLDQILLRLPQRVDLAEDVKVEGSFPNWQGSRVLLKIVPGRMKRNLLNQWRQRWMRKIPRLTKKQKRRLKWRQRRMRKKKRKDPQPVLRAEQRVQLLLWRKKKKNKMKTRRKKERNLLREPLVVEKMLKLLSPKRQRKWRKRVQGDHRLAVVGQFQFLYVPY
jgi:hypothetical protein